MAWLPRNGLMAALQPGYGPILLSKMVDNDTESTASGGSSERLWRRNLREISPTPSGGDSGSGSVIDCSHGYGSSDVGEEDCALDGEQTADNGHGTCRCSWCGDRSCYPSGDPPSSQDARSNGRLLGNHSGKNSRMVSLIASCDPAAMRWQPRSSAIHLPPAPGHIAPMMSQPGLPPPPTFEPGIAPPVRNGQVVPPPPTCAPKHFAPTIKSSVLPPPPAYAPDYLAPAMLEPELPPAPIAPAGVPQPPREPPLLPNTMVAHVVLPQRVA